MPVHALAFLFAAAIRLFVVTRSATRVLTDAGTEPGPTEGPSPQRQRHEHLTRCLASVILDVARQDGEVDGQELSAAVEMVSDQLDAPPEDRRGLEELFRELAIRAVPLEQACQALSEAMRDDEREHLIGGLYGLSTVDGELHRAERARVRHVAGLLQVPPQRRRTALVRALGSVALCYELLDVSPRASNEELADAYRRRSAELSSEDEERAQLDTAWQELRRMRGMDAPASGPR